jgi:proline iminopeptidase
MLKVGSKSNNPEHKILEIMQIKNLRFRHSFLFILITLLVFVQNTKAEQSKGFSITEGLVRCIDGVDLYYQVRGTGQDTLVMLHGGPGLNFDYLAPDLKPLEESFTLIYYDQRGSGRSSLVSQPDLLTVDDHVADLEAVRKYFGIDRLSLFGHSWGAMLASFYALKHPEKLSRMVFASPGPPRNTPYMQQLIPNLMEWMDSATQAKAEQLMEARQDATISAKATCEAFWELFIRSYFADPHDLETIRSMRGNFCSGSETALLNGGLVWIHTFESAGEFDLRNKLQDVNIPVLIISGTEDIFPEESMREWKAAYPDSRLILLEQAAHYPQIEQPQEYFPLVKEFLRE